MAIIDNFCFYFSVRLGSLLVGIFAMIQTSIYLMIFIMLRDSPKELSRFLHDLYETIAIDSPLIRDFINDPKIFITCGTAFLIGMLFACAILILGVFQVKAKYLYLFILFYFLKIMILLGMTIIFMLWIKAKGNGLGDLILYSNLAGFILLFYLYTWACVVSYLQIINELRKRVDKKLKARKMQQFGEKFHNYPLKPVISYNYIK